MWIDQKIYKELHGVMPGISTLLKSIKFAYDVPCAAFYYLVCKPMKAYRLETKQIHWMQKQKIESSVAALGATALNDSNVPSTAWNISPGENSIELRLLCDAADQGGTARIYAQKITNIGVDADIALAAELAVTSGAQTTARDGKTFYYVDTIVVTNHWMKNLAEADAEGGNRMARIGFDALGYRTLFVLIEYAGSHTWYVDSTGF